MKPGYLFAVLIVIALVLLMLAGCGEVRCKCDANGYSVLGSPQERTKCFAFCSDLAKLRSDGVTTDRVCVLPNGWDQCAFESRALEAIQKALSER